MSFFGNNFMSVLVNGNLRIPGTIIVVGAATLASATVTGDVSVGATLAVTGASTLTGDIAAGNLTMAASKVLMVDSGTGAAGTAPLQFRGGGTNSGLYMSTADQLSVARLGSNSMNLSGSGGPSANTTFTTSGSLVASAAIIVSGALRRVSAAAKTSNYVLLATDNIMTAGSGCGTVTTPATPVTGQSIIVLNQSGGAVTLTANSGQTIDGAGTASLADNSMTLLQLGADGVTWYGGEVAAA